MPNKSRTPAPGGLEGEPSRTQTHTQHRVSKRRDSDRACESTQDPGVRELDLQVTTLWEGVPHEGAALLFGLGSALGAHTADMKQGRGAWAGLLHCGPSGLTPPQRDGGCPLQSASTRCAQELLPARGVVGFIIIIIFCDKL